MSLSDWDLPDSSLSCIPYNIELWDDLNTLLALLIQYMQAVKTNVLNRRLNFVNILFQFSTDIWAMLQVL